jgi:PTS system mannitol-specific IIA component/phosphocarrier protein FPr
VTDPTVAGTGGTASGVLTSDAVRLGRTASDKWDVVRQAGALLIEIGAVSPPYAEAMLERERSVSTYIGEGVAIPHGTDESREFVQRTALGVLQYPDGVDWDGDRMTVAVAIASSGHEHVAVLQALAEILMEPDQAERLRGATDPDDVVALLAAISTDEEDS